MRSERVRRQARIAEARERAAQAERPEKADEAVPSELGIRSIDDVEPGPCYLYCRESGDRQRANLPGQKLGARRYLEERGFTVKHAWGEVCSGKTLDPAKRRGLMKALDTAKREGIPLATPAPSRFLRHPDFHPHQNNDAKPTRDQFEEFMRLAEGVTVFTCNDPDSSPAEDATFLGEISVGTENRNPGRPREKFPGYRKAVKAKYLLLATRLRVEGRSNPEIARVVSHRSGFPITAEGIRR
jgi:hypothetical protein